MFESQEKLPWYRSSLLLVGVALAVGVVALIGVWRLARYGGKEAHYAELERSRELQRQQMANAPAEQAAAPAAAPQTATDPNAANSNAQQQGQQPAANAGAPA